MPHEAFHSLFPVFSAYPEAQHPAVYILHTDVAKPHSLSLNHWIHIPRASFDIPLSAYSGCL
ncbi:hypothetical protein D3C78_1496850 [compost metagenome]